MRGPVELVAKRAMLSGFKFAVIPTLIQKLFLHHQLGHEFHSFCNIQNPSSIFGSEKDTIIGHPAGGSCLITLPYFGIKGNTQITTCVNVFILDR